MSDLTETVERIFAAHCTDQVRLAAEQDVWPKALWRAVEDAGLPLALVHATEEDLTVRDAFDIVRLAGAHAAPIPLPETMLANWLLVRARLAPVEGPVVYANASGIVANGDTRVKRCVAHVPWGRRARVLGGYTQGNDFRLKLCLRDETTTRQRANIAKEPRDDVSIDVTSEGSVVAPLGLSPTAVHAMAAALRTAQMAGAIEAATRLTVDYVKTRVQFGKPLAKFQAIQQQVAVLAEQAALSRAATDMAADALSQFNVNIEAVAAAKIVAGEAANVTANIAHQMHGAIGFSQAYQLHHLTRRLWSWRDDDGNEAYWAAQLGGYLTRKGADNVWAEITTL